MISCPRQCGKDVSEHHSTDLVNGGCDTGPMPFSEMLDWFEERGAERTWPTTSQLITKHYGKTRDELNEWYASTIHPVG